MKIIIFDTEYLSISRRYSGLIGITKFKKKLFPEIIQISFLKLSNVFLSNNKKKKLNLFIKIRQKIPRRISKLTGIRQSILDKKGYLFQDAIKIIDKFIKKKSILIANGDDVKLIKLNLSHNNIKKRKKKLIYFFKNS